MSRTSHRQLQRLAQSATPSKAGYKVRTLPSLRCRDRMRANILLYHFPAQRLLTTSDAAENSEVVDATNLGPNHEGDGHNQFQHVRPGTTITTRRGECPGIRFNVPNPVKPHKTKRIYLPVTLSTYAHNVYYVK